MPVTRVFLIVLDSLGIGALPDAADYGDLGANTFGAISKSGEFYVPNLKRLGIFNIDGVNGEGAPSPLASFGRAAEASKGKDTTIGHWEIAGLITGKPLPTYPKGFPEEIISELEKKTGRKILCNKPYSGTEVIRDYGREQAETGALIVYTSADSVLQIAAHEDTVPPDQLYEYCKIARKIMSGERAVGRIIARPYIGEFPNYTRTDRRRDFSLPPQGETLLDILSKAGLDVISVGKIGDIFAGRGITELHPCEDNRSAIEITCELQNKAFKGLAFVNLVDFDMVYGHRNDTDGYARALSVFDVFLGGFLGKMKASDALIITADHGCDPSDKSTDHTREYVPILFYGHEIEAGRNLGTRKTFADIGQTVAGIFGLKLNSGTAF
jgi:phosphopentomutase